MEKNNKRNILITGGAGFIGSHLVDALIKEGNKVVIIDNLSTGRKENLNPKAKFYKCDIRDLKKIKPLFKEIDYVFHVAAQPRIQPSIKDPISSNENNLVGTLNVLLAARDAGVKKVIYSASSSVYGNQKELPLKETMKVHPKNPYALQKYVSELYCRLFYELYGLPSVCLRYFNVYGPRQVTAGAYATVVGIFLKQKASGKPLTIVGDGKQRRDFTFVSDIVRANILAMKKSPGKGEIINIGSGKNYSVNEVARLIEGKTLKIPPRPGESRITLADISLANKLMGWKPRVNLADWIKKNR